MSKRIEDCRGSDGVRIAHTVVGGGAPLVIAASGLSSIEHEPRSPLWRHYLELFARHFRVVRYDHRGTGRSQREVEDFSLDALAADLEAVVDHLGLDRFSLAAFSSGCQVAIEVAARRPEQVDRLLIIGAAARGWARREPELDTAAHRALFARVADGWGTDEVDFVEAWASLYEPERDQSHLRQWIELQGAIAPPAVAAKLMRAAAEFDVTKRLTDVVAPTLVAHARGDQLVPLSEAAALASRLASARLIEVDSRRHIVLPDDPGWPALKRSLLDFLNDPLSGVDARSVAAEPVAELASGASPPLDVSDFLVTGGALRGELIQDVRADLGLPQSEQPYDDGEPSPGTIDDELVGSTVGRYEITGRLGVGGMGMVYRAMDTRLSRPVALKFLTPDRTEDASALERFEREARVVSALNHPNICVLHEIGRHRGRPFLVLELLEGTTLEKLIKEGPIAPERALEIGTAIADGLDAAHEAGVLHRDIKPANIVVTHRGHVKILDFGIAKLLPAAFEVGASQTEVTHERSLTRTGTTVGTYAFMSPEQVRGEELDGRTDVFSLGAVLYEMLSGRGAFTRPTAGSIIDAILRDDPPSLADRGHDARIDAVVRRALAKDPAQRFSSAGELRDSLRQLRLELLSTSRHRLSAWAGWTPRRRWSVGAIAVVAGLAVITALLVGRAPNTPPPAAGGTTAVAVLPFEDLSPEPMDGYMAMSVPDELTNVLTRAHGLAVRPYSETRRISAIDSDPTEVGRTLGADYLVTGQLYLQDGSLRLTLEAIEADAKRIAWRDTLVLAADELIDLRRLLSERVQQGLLPALGAEGGEPGSVPRSAEAYRLYLESRSLLIDPQPNQHAIEMLERSIELDPGFAPAFAELGHRLFTAAYYWDAGAVDLARSKWAVERALELDPDHLEATGTLVEWLVEDGDVVEAYRAARRVVAHRPQSGYGYILTSIALRYGGLLEDAVRACERGHSLDPRDRRLRACTWTFLWAGDYESTATFVSRTASLLLNNEVNARMALMQGDTEKALRLWTRQVDPSAGRLRRDAVVACLEGRPDTEVEDRFRNDFEELVLIQDPEWHFLSAGLFTYCGHEDIGLELLRRAVASGYCVDPSPEVDPLLAPLAASTELADIRVTARECRDRVRREIDELG